MFVNIIKNLSLQCYSPVEDCLSFLPVLYFKNDAKKINAFAESGVNCSTGLEEQMKIKN